MTETNRRPDAPDPPREAVVGQGVLWLSRWTLRWLILAVGLAALFYVVSLVWSILLPVVLALVLATVLQPPARWLERRAGLAPGLAAAAMVVGFLGLLAVVVVFLVPTVTSQAGEIADNASEGLTQLQRQLASSGLVTEEQIASGIEALQDRIEASGSSIASGVLVGVNAFTTALINAILTLVLAFFFLKDGRRFLPWAGESLGRTAGRHVTEVLGRCWTTLGGFVRTQALVGLIDAVLIGVGLAIVGVPLALPLAVLTFVAAFAPVVGAIVVGALAVLVALVTQGYVAALIVFAIVLVVQQLEGNVFLPFLQGRTLNLHAGVVLLSIVLGSTLFGVAGAFLSVPTVALVAVVLRYVNEVVAARSDERDPDEDVDEDDAAGSTATDGHGADGDADPARAT